MLFTAFLIGFLGQLHCLGMCGPLALALPKVNMGGASRFMHALVYNVGRIATYTMLGLLFGIIGEGLNLAGFQRYLSVAMGAILISVILFPPLLRHLEKANVLLLFEQKVRMAFSRFISHKSISTKFMIGIFNGLLPCGLVYLAIAGAIASGGILDGGKYMMIFGLGTLPSMFLLSFLGYNIKAKLGVGYKKVVPYFVVVVGLLFVLRGLNLGIPYVSPDISSDMQNVEMCH